MEIYTQIPDQVTRDALRRLSDSLDNDNGQGDAEATAGQGELATVPGNGLAVDGRRRRGAPWAGGNGEM
jgi:hypothetical protein